MPAPDRRIPAPLVALAPVLVLVLSATGPFDGCGGGSSERRPLPRDTAMSCFDDADCTPVGCEDLRCVAGLCSEVAPIRDADGDLAAPPPCGLDCDDTTREIGPDRPELCDLVDQDCDGMVDEDAPPMAIRFEADTRDPAMIVLPWGPDALVTDVLFSPGSVLARVVSLEERTVGVSRRVLDLGEVEILAVAARPTAEGGVVALAVRAGITQEIVIATVRRGDAGVVELVGDPVHHAVSEVSALDVTRIGGVDYVAWDQGTTRFLWSPSWADPVQVADGLVEGLGSLDLATDGAHVVVPAGPRTLAFHDLSGAAAGTQETTGELANGRPIADADGAVYAIVRDAFDYSVQRVTLGTAGPLSPALAADPLTVLFGADVFGSRLYITRASSRGTSAGYAETSNLEAYTPFPSGEITGDRTAPVRSVTVLELPAGPVIVTNFGDAGSTFTLLACRAM